MRVLVTGGAGFIGSHISLMLLQNGYDVVIYDSFVNSSFNVIKAIKKALECKNINYNLNIINGDIRDKNNLKKMFKDFIDENNPIQTVIHLAGLKSVSESIAYPLNYWDVNVCGTRTLLETMSENNCFSIVFSSSATIYGLTSLIPIAEDQDLSPISPYGKTKVAIEEMLNDLYTFATNTL